MTWLQRYRLGALFRTSVWIVPLGAMLAALAAAPVVRQLDAWLGWRFLGFSPDGARAVLGALTTALMTFIVFVFSILLVAVQMAGAQLTPRIIARSFRNPTTRLCLGLFTFAFTWTTTVLGRIEQTTPQLSALIAVLLGLASIAAFLYLIDCLGKGLRPVSVLADVGAEGHDVLVAVYPRIIKAGEEPETPPPFRPEKPPTHTLEAHQSGVVLAFDSAGLLAIARRADSLIELVPQVGDFVALGDPLFRVHGDLPPHEEGKLRSSVVLGPERTLEQDPAFAFRIIVDVAIKGLSPAINDPTTAVLALDQLHHLLREAGRRHLDDCAVRDERGRVRLHYRTPSWEAFVVLAISEIRQYGGGSLQVTRRLRALLENLIENLPRQRAAVLERELALLQEAVKRSFPDVEDRSRAATGDYQGIGAEREEAYP